MVFFFCLNGPHRLFGVGSVKDMTNRNGRRENKVGRGPNNVREAKNKIEHVSGNRTCVY